MSHLAGRFLERDGEFALSNFEELFLPNVGLGCNCEAKKHGIPRLGLLR